MLIMLKTLHVGLSLLYNMSHNQDCNENDVISLWSFDSLTTETPKSCGIEILQLFLLR